MKSESVLELIYFSTAVKESYQYFPRSLFLKLVPHNDGSRKHINGQVDESKPKLFEKQKRDNQEHIRDLICDHRNRAGHKSKIFDVRHLTEFLLGTRNVEF